ncbi:hypothetical protein PYCC9005_002403 [Savitreella phatthalungensis]
MSHAHNIDQGAPAPHADTSRAQAAGPDGRHPTNHLTDAKDAPGSAAHIGSDVPAPGNKEVGTGGPTSLSNEHSNQTGSQGGPGGIGSVSAGLADSSTRRGEKDAQGAGQPLEEPKDGAEKKITPEEANAKGDGTFGDGKFDAAAPGAGLKAQQISQKAHVGHGEDEKLETPVN